MTQPHRRAAATVALALAAFGLTGCDNGSELGSSTAAPRTLVVSTAYVQSHHEDGAARLSQLQAGIDQLRSESGSGWTGRQDDETGYLGELTGGRFFADQGASADDVVTSLMERYGDTLFGIGAQDLELGGTTPVLDNGTAAIRATQRVGSVPVLDGALVFTIGSSDTEPRVNAVRGRVYPDLDVDTTPTLTARQAAKVAVKISHGLPQGRPTLVVMPTPSTGSLAWEVAIAGSAADALGSRDGYYFVDADSGAVLDTRAATAERTAPVALRVGSGGRITIRAVGRVTRLTAAAAGGTVTVSGTSPNGQTLSANGLATANGIQLYDTTVPTYDPQTGQGGVATFDAHHADDYNGLPGTLYTQQGGTTVTDPEAIAAAAYDRAVYDYYASLGRRSWDGKGATLIGSVHYSDDHFCNSFFNGSLDPPQMVYGSGCVDGGTKLENSELDIDIAGHEITHGVTNSSAGLQYLGQSGALNESFSDYFGNVIGDQEHGQDSSAIFEDSCFNITADSGLCHDNPDGSRSTRYMLNGTTFDDFLFLINPPLRLQNAGLDDQDHGGVHENSSVWNNALWSIRSQLATIDGTTMLKSRLAHDFDKIVYYALTTQLTPTSDFLDARKAIEQTITDAGADPVILRVARQTFELNHICSECGNTGAIPGIPLAISGESEVYPAVSGSKVAWVSQGEGGLGTAAEANAGGGASPLADRPELAQVSFAGDAVVALSFPDGKVPGQVVRIGSDGNPNPIGSADISTLNAGVAGGEGGAAWVNAREGTVSYVDASGKVTSGGYPGADGDTVTSVGAGAGMVALGTEHGQVYSWQPGGQVNAVGRMDSAILSLAAYGTRIIAVDDKGAVSLFDTAGNQTQLSTSGTSLGAAMGKDYAIWTESLGDQSGGVSQVSGVTYPETDLYLYSFRTGTVYDLLPERGQQGFPALSGNRLVWQDSVLGGDDIFTATIPSGL